MIERKTEVEQEAARLTARTQSYILWLWERLAGADADRAATIAAVMDYDRESFNEGIGAAGDLVARLASDHPTVPGLAEAAQAIHDFEAMQQADLRDNPSAGRAP